MWPFLADLFCFYVWECVEKVTMREILNPGSKVCKQRHTCHSASVSLLRKGSRCGVSRSCLYSNQRERRAPSKTTWLSVITQLFGLWSQGGERENNYTFLCALLQWMKDDVRFESYGNGRLSVRMWWGGVERYLREIKQDPLRHFVLPTLKASGNLPRSASTEYIGGVRKLRRGLTLSSLPVQWGGGGWNTPFDWPLCISKCLHLFVQWSTWKNAFILCWALLWASPYDLCDNRGDWEQCEDSVLQTFCLAFIFYQYESHRHQVVWSIERHVSIYVDIINKSKRSPWRSLDIHI